MKLQVVPMLLCAAIALAASPVALAADDAERPPKELWDEFPLEPSATPAQAAPQAGPSSTPAPVERSDGMSPGALVVLLVAAAGVGGLAALTATRRMRRGATAPVATAQPGRRAPAAAAKARARGREETVTRPHPANGDGQPAESAPDRSKARRRAANRPPQPTKPVRQSDSQRRRAADEPAARNGGQRPNGDTTRPHAANRPSTDQDGPDTARREAVNDRATPAAEQTPKPAGDQAAKSTEQTPSAASGRAAKPTGKTQSAASGRAAKPTGKTQSAASGRAAKPTGKTQSAASGRPAEAGELHAGRGPERSARAAKPARKTTTPRKRDARGRFVKSEPAAEPQAPAPQTPVTAPEPPAAKATPPPDEPATPDRGRVAPFEPAAATAPPPPPAWSPVAGPDAWESCKIKLHNRSIRAHFYAVPHEGGPVLARSPYFKVRRDEGDTAFGAPDALRALVNELAAAGWRQTGVGRAPWDLRFERGARAERPAAPRRRA